MSLHTPASPPRGQELTFWMAVALVMGNMIGSGIFLLPASLASYGGLSLAGWGFSTAGAVLLALVFARLSRQMPAAGGPYAYTREAFGDLAGFLVAWGYWISMWSTTGALAVAFVGYLDPFFPTLVRTPATAAIMALGTMWALTAVNIWGVRRAGHVQVWTTMLKILPLLAVGFVGLLWLEPTHFAIPEADGPPVAARITSAATLTLWAFLGLESATVPAGAIRDANRTIPRATVVGTLVAAAIYVVSTVGVMGIISPDALARSTAPFADAAGLVAGGGARAIIALGAAVSCFGALNGWILLAGQLPLAVARDGLFPAVFGRTTERGSPAHGLIIAGVLTSALVGMNYSRQLVDLFTFIILLSTLQTLIPYVFSTMAALMPAVAGRSPAAAARAQARPPLPTKSVVVACLAFAYSLWAIGGAGADVVYWGFLLLVAGLPVYVWVVRQGRKALEG